MSHKINSFFLIFYRILHFARDYSQKRSAFGQLISKYPLHLQTMARMEIETRGSLLLMLEVIIISFISLLNQITILNLLLFIY